MTGDDVIVGASLVLATIIEKLCVSKAVAASVTRTVTGFAPTSSLVGVQRIRPVLALMLMPVGAASNENVNVSPTSGSVASTS